MSKYWPFCTLNSPVVYSWFLQFLIFSNILGTSAEVYKQLAEYSNATSMNEVTNIVDGLPYIKGNLTLLKASTNGLRVNASQLNDGK